jgi:hypothetical protein
MSDRKVYLLSSSGLAGGSRTYQKHWIPVSTGMTEEDIYGIYGQTLARKNQERPKKIQMLF